MLHELSTRGAHTVSAPPFCKLTGGCLMRWAWHVACPNSADPWERLGLGQGSSPCSTLPLKTYLSAPHRFITKKGRQVCANPEQDWVQEYMSDLELN